MKNITLNWACIILMTSSIAGCANQTQAGNEPRTLEPVEVNEYQGEKLSSWKDFRENSIKGPQHIDIADYSLEVSGLVTSPRSFKYEDLIAREKFKKVVKLNCVEGWSVNILWEGILLKDLLQELGVQAKANTVIFYGYDGYSTSFPLDYVIKNNILLADKMNDEPLRPERGFPFQLVAEQKWGYKWIKWVTGIELSDNQNYEGYWEKYGYSKDGDLGKSFIER
ncbi:MAG TPA: molybdopterin-dependent oxidoreductase [archaeon]|nr:molybdopterin-dependent oxidoreductase [archaeon]